MYAETLKFTKLNARHEEKRFEKTLSIAKVYPY
jgi:hypothetical protein